MNTTPYPGDPERILLVKILDVLNAGGGSSGGSGTVTSFSAGALSPLFTTSVATATSTPALSFALDTQNANKVFAGPTTGADAAPTFRAMVNADLGTGLTPQFLRLGVGSAADATIKLLVTGISAGAATNVVVGQLEVPTSNPFFVLGTAGANAGAFWGYDRPSNTMSFGIYGNVGLTVGAGGATSTPGNIDAASFSAGGTAGVANNTFDGTNTVTVKGGLIVNIA